MRHIWVLLLSAALTAACELNPTVDVGGSGGDFRLYPPYPNPFSRALQVSLDVPDRRSFVLLVQNPCGDEVVTLLRGPLEPGRHSVRWNGKNASGKEVGPGFYFITLKVDSEIQSYVVKLEK